MDSDQSSDSSIVEMNNSNSILHKIANIYAEQLMSDICLVVGNNHYAAHRLILCASSEVFQVMLMNPEWNECREKVIELKEEEWCSLVFPQFLKYLYDGKIRISLQSVMPMLALADKYNIKDLVQLCVDYMLKHIAKAATQGYLISWLQYTISFSPYHHEVTDACQRFLKWNFDIVSESKDFTELDINILIILLQQNDLILKSEFDLFSYIEKWVMHKKEVIHQEQTLTEDEKVYHTRQMIESVISHIRFAMMSPNELAKLLLQPVTKLHKEFFVDRISIGMNYHAGKDEFIQAVRKTETGSLQFTPRLYTRDMGVSMTLSDFETVEIYQKFAAYFFLQCNLSEYEDDSVIGWEVDFFPRGIKFNKAKIINVYNMQGAIEIPETCLRTVRLRVTCSEKIKTDQRFKIAVLINGVQNKIPYIRTVHEKTHYFSPSNRVLNMDNLLPYDELELSSIKLSPHLIGNKSNELSIEVIIAPMGHYICRSTPDFEFK